MNPPSTDNITVIIGDKPYTLVPQSNVNTIQQPIDVKKQIVTQFKERSIDKETLKKVVGHEMKKVKQRNGESRIVLTLDDETIVMFTDKGMFFLVGKNDNKISIEYYENIRGDIENGEIFKHYDVYVDADENQRNVFVPTIISGGGSRKNYRKSAKRVRSAKKSSQSRVRKYRK
jgi:hypothetical protein